MEKKETKELKKVESVETQRKQFAEIYGEENIRILTLPLDDFGKEELDIIALVPKRKVISLFIQWIDKSVEKANDILINNCLLTSKEEVMKNDDLYFSCANGIAGLIKIRDAKLKN